VTRPAKLIFYALGTGLLLASLAYVGLGISRNWSSLEQVRLHSLPWLLACVGIYAASHLSTGLSWPLAVRQLGTQVSFRDGLRIGLVAQIGKYLPGNIAHYAGRGLLAKQRGISFTTTGISTAIELGSALSAVMMVAAIAVAFDPRPIAWLPIIPSSSVVIVLILAAGMAAVWTWLLRRGVGPMLLAGPTLCLAISFILSGLSIYALSQALGHVDVSLAVAVGTFALAWGVGFIVPGAPAGLGVREAILLALLGPMVGAGPAIAIALFHRLITAVVDAIAALVGYAWLTADSFAKK
jgi:uncharacterized membrane protein YbhN (UPF0104 family)